MKRLFGWMMLWICAIAMIFAFTPFTYAAEHGGQEHGGAAMDKSAEPEVLNEDANGNGVLDEGEDGNGNGALDKGSDANGDGILQDEEIEQEEAVAEAEKEHGGKEHAGN